MIKEDNMRLTITLSREDCAIVGIMADQLNISKSRFIRLTINQFMYELANRLNKNDN